MAGYRTIGLTVSTAVFMQFLDATALNTALPAMGRDLHVSAVSLNIVIIAYQIALAALIPVGNIAADRIGARNAFTASLLVFMVGSLLCAMSRSLPALVAARAFQGLGGAVMTPVSRQLVVRSAEKHELVSAINWLLIPGIVGPLLGPVLGGIMVTYASWHWIFLINLPVAVIGIVLTLALVPEDGVRSSRRIDTRGVLLVATTIICGISGLEGLAQPRIGSGPWILLAASLLLGLLYIQHARRDPQAALDMSLLQIASFRHSAIAGTLLRVIVGATGFLLPLWFQLAMGMTAAQSGLLAVASTVGALLSRLVGGTLMRRLHPRSIAIGGAASVVVALLLVASLHAGASPGLFWLLLLAEGVAVSIPFMIITAVAYVEIPPERLGAATALYTTIQQLTLSLGVTAGVWAIAVMRRLAHSGPADGVTYSGSLVMLATVGMAAIYSVSRLGRDALGALRR